MIKLRVRNYQSVEDAEIEVSGLTVITGQNNTGKSAMLRAVYGAFTNARGTKYVRHGRDSCAVSVTFGDGRSVQWEKGEKLNRYTVDGKVLDKVGAGVPPEVEALGVVPISASGRELWPQFAQQFTGQVFLLDQPGSVLAESVADVSRVGVLNEALRNAQSDKRTMASELKVRLADVARYESQEISFSGLDAVEALSIEAEALKAKTDELDREREEAQEFYETLQAHQTLSSSLAPVRTIVVPDGVSGIRSDLLELIDLSGLASRLFEAVGTVKSLSPVSDTPLPDAVRATKLFEALSVVSDLLRQMDPLNEILRDAVTLRDAVSESLPDFSSLDEDAKRLNGYRQLQVELSTRFRAASSIRGEISTIEKEYDEALHEVQELLNDAGNCPICGRG